MMSPSIELPIFTVSALTQSIKLVLEGQFRYVCVQGEVSNSKLQTSGHFYFTLKDPQAQITAVMFKGDLSSLRRLPKDGDQVIVKGALNIYPPSGKYQIVTRSLEWAGLGALLLKLEELKIKLKAKGLFSQEHKKPLPRFPQKIGVVTSPTGAVIQDIVNILTRRFYGFHLILFPVKVQGEGAAEEISRAIDFLNQHRLVDVMIIGRGGGSIEDLWAFNEEIVAEAIYRSQIPIISAVGHETDHCIADEVADVRAPTPSAAAEIVIAEKTHLLKHIAQAECSLRQSLLHMIRTLRMRFNGLLKHPLLASPYPLLGSKMQRIDDLKTHFDRQMHLVLSKNRLKLIGLHRQNEALKPLRRIIDFREKLRLFSRSFYQSILKKQEGDKKHLQHLIKVLHAVDPRQLLTKGYSIVILEKTGSIIKSIHSLSKGDTVKLLFADGMALSTINEKKENG